MIVTIHQPEHVPWLGFFDKLTKADVVVFLDNVQFRKNYFQNRNRVRTAQGWSWITVPVHHGSDTLIKDVVISGRSRWAEKWCNTVYYSYRKARYFDDYFGEVREMITGGETSLGGLNIGLIKLICGWLGKNLLYLKASELGVQGASSRMILDICKETGADTYLSGISGRDYLDEESFRKEKVAIRYQFFHHPVYTQIYRPFAPCMSVLDLLFNYGGESADIISGRYLPVMRSVFL